MGKTLCSDHVIARFWAAAKLDFSSPLNFKGLNFIQPFWIILSSFLMTCLYHRNQQWCIRTEVQMAPSLALIDGMAVFQWSLVHPSVMALTLQRNTFSKHFCINQKDYNIKIYRLSYKSPFLLKEFCFLKGFVMAASICMQFSPNDSLRYFLNHEILRLFFLYFETILQKKVNTTYCIGRFFTQTSSWHSLPWPYSRILATVKHKALLAQ